RGGGGEVEEEVGPHGVATEKAEEGGELLDLREGVLGAGLRHGRLEVDMLRKAKAESTLKSTEIDDAGLEGAVGAGDDGLPRQHHEPRHVAAVVLDPVRQHLQPVQLRRPGRRDCRRVPQAFAGHVLRGAGRVVEGLAGDVEAEASESELALGQRLRVAHHPGEVLLAHARERQQAVVHRELHLPHDVEPAPEKQVVVAVDAAAQGVLDWEHRAVRDPQLHRLERHLELVARDRLAVGVRLPGRRLTVRARHALVRHAEPRPVHRCRREVRDGQRPRQVRDGIERSPRAVDGGRGAVVVAAAAVVVGLGVGGGGAAGGGGRFVGGGAVDSGGLAGEDGAGGLPVGTVERGGGGECEADPAVAPGGAGAVVGCEESRAAAMGDMLLLVVGGSSYRDCNTLQKGEQKLKQRVWLNQLRF
ncbi:hypothetical protein BHE74_00031467, partial [Ensete ventricosum]